MTRRTLIPTLLLAAATALPAGTADAGGAIGIHVGGAGFGFSVSAGDWAPYGAGWTDPGWRFDLDVTLASYGEWVWVDGLGRVWRPSVAASWRPYTNGRWVWTSAGWTWVSYEPWGYLPHHFGSWAYSAYGWVWTPGWDYSPANVVWLGHGDWIGWYPCAPRGWSHAARSYRHGYRDGYRSGYGTGYDDGWRDASHATWTRWRHFGDDNVADWSAAPPDLATAVDRGRVRPLSSPPTLDAVRSSGARVVETRLERRAVEVDGHRIEMARPAGVEDSVRRHGAETVRTAMPAIAARRPAARPTVESPATSGRTLVRPPVNEVPPHLGRGRAAITDRPSKPAPTTLPSMGRAELPRTPDAVQPGRTRFTPEARRPMERPSTTRPAPAPRPQLTAPPTVRRAPSGSSPRAIQPPPTSRRVMPTVRSADRTAPRTTGSRPATRPRTPEAKRPATGRTQREPATARSRKATSPSRHERD